VHDDDEQDALKREEPPEAFREIRERVGGRCPAGSAKGPPLPDPMSVARAKVASIGTVKPRPPGAINSLVQISKRVIARLLYWHAREQVDFNRGVLGELDHVRAHWAQ